MRRMGCVLIVALVLMITPAGAMRRVHARYRGGAHTMEAAIRATWPARLHREALNVAWCESRGSSTARNGQYRGYFQMGRWEWATYGQGSAYDGEANAAAAYRYYRANGNSWRRWECRP